MNRRWPLVWGLVCALSVLSWQELTVHFNYRDNWTGLFVTGQRFAVPPSLASEHVWQAPHSYGWDGQFYHFIAHDPFLLDGMSRYTEAARLRYRRILIPAAAFLLAAGQTGAIDWSYRLVVLLFFLLGTYWTARILAEHGRNPAWGLLFFFLPAAIASTDRMAVDVGLSALVAAFALYSRRPEDRVKLYAVLVFAGLVRDTGLFLTGGYCLWLLTGEGPLSERVKQAAVFATAAIPTLGWYLYVNLHTGPFQGGAALSIPLSGLIDRFVHPVPCAETQAVAVTIHTFDFVAVVGVLAALVLAMWKVTTRVRRPAGYVMVLFVALGVFFWRPGDWMEALDYGRIFTPLMFLLGLDVLEGCSWVGLLPLAMEAPRFGIQVGSQALGVARGILGMQ